MVTRRTPTPKQSRMSEPTDSGMDQIPTSPKPPCVVVDRTLAIIKPDSIDRAEEIIEDILSNGFTILQVATFRVLIRVIQFLNVFT